jgi:chromosome segregation ATPase
MVQVDATAAELKAALDRLEEVALPLAQARAQASADATEIASLKRECERLLARIGELENQTRTLAGVTDEVEGRLDEAIAEIRSVLAQ